MSLKRKREQYMVLVLVQRSGCSGRTCSTFWPFLLDENAPFLHAWKIQICCGMPLEVLPAEGLNFEFFLGGWKFLLTMNRIEPAEQVYLIFSRVHSASTKLWYST